MATLTDALRETLALFDPGTPQTTSEVAAHLDIGRRSTYERLNRLVEQGYLETKKVGGNGRVWWVPSGDVTAVPVEQSGEERAGSGTRAQFESEFRNHSCPSENGLSVSLCETTERKERERALQEAKTRLEAATRAGEVGTWQWYVPEDRLVTDDWFKRAFGIDTEQPWDGRPLEAFLSRVHEGDRNEVERKIEAALSSCGEYEAEFRVRDVDGKLRWMVARGHVECDEDGNPLTFPGAITDITERKRTEMELERQREQLAALNSLHETVRAITDAVVERSTREEIEEVVCERLVDSESYTFAWVADVDSQTQEIYPRAEVGVDGYLEEIDLSADPDEPVGQGPAGRAVRTGEMHVSTNVFDDSTFEPWYEYAEKYGYQSFAAIPITHEDTLYGLLGVYSERPDAFEKTERAVIGQLGEIVGYAIASADRKQALMSDEVVELEFRFPDVSEVFDTTQPVEGPFTFDRSVQVDDDSFLQYGRAAEGAVDTLESLVEHADSSDYLKIIDRESDIARFEIRQTNPPITSAVATHGGRIQHAVVEDDEFHLTVHLPPSVSARKIIAAIEEVYPQADLRTRQQVNRGDESLDPVYETLRDELTDRQRTVLEAATYSGFFEWPRESSGEDIAESLGIAPPTFSQHLRKAQGKVFGALLESSTPS